MGKINRGKLHDAIPILQIRPHHRAMARDMVHGGLTSSQLAKTYDFSQTQISRILGCPAFQAYLRHLESGAEDLARQPREEIAEMSLTALQNIDEDLGIEPANVPERRLRQNASFKVLEIAGYVKKESPSQHLHLHKHTAVPVEELSDEELAEDVMDLIEHKED